MIFKCIDLSPVVKQCLGKDPQATSLHDTSELSRPHRYTRLICPCGSLRQYKQVIITDMCKAKLELINTHAGLLHFLDLYRGVLT